MLKHIFRYIGNYMYNMPCYFVSRGVEIPMTNETFDFIWNGFGNKELTDSDSSSSSEESDNPNSSINKNTNAEWRKQDDGYYNTIQRIRIPERRTAFHKCSPDIPSEFPSIFHFPSWHVTLARVKTTTALACTNPSLKPITTSMTFCHSIFRVVCHVWVKLCSEKLCGFCTSCSAIVCSKLPLQLVFFQFNMPPLYLNFIIR